MPRPGRQPPFTPRSVRHWRLCLAVRDAFPVGRSHRYGDAQIRYPLHEGPRGPMTVHGRSVREEAARPISLLPAATEIVASLGMLDALLGVSHECDYPAEVNGKPRVTHL